EVDASLDHRRCDHEDDQKHQHHVHQRRDVDLRHRPAGVARLGQLHETYCSTRWMKSVANSSIWVLRTFTRLLKWLYAMTAGIAAASPAAVVTRASAIPGA